MLARRFLASQPIAILLPGVTAVYIYSLYRVFAIVRQWGGQTLFVLTHIAPDDVTIDIGSVAGGPACGLLSKRVFSSRSGTMKPYDVLWLTLI